MAYRRSHGIKPRTTPKCGTYSGYEKHRKNQEATCQDCKTAKNTYLRGWETERRRLARRGSTADIVADYVETFAPLDMPELVMLIRFEHDIASETILRQTYRMLKDGRLSDDDFTVPVTGGFGKVRENASSALSATFTHLEVVLTYNSGQDEEWGRDF